MVDRGTEKNKLIVAGDALLCYLYLVYDLDNLKLAVAVAKFDYIYDNVGDEDIILDIQSNNSNITVIRESIIPGATTARSYSSTYAGVMTGSASSYGTKSEFTGSYPTGIGVLNAANGKLVGGGLHNWSFQVLVVGMAFIYGLWVGGGNLGYIKIKIYMD